MSTRTTKAQLQAEVEALRHNTALLEAQIEALRTQLADAEAKLAAVPAAKPAAPAPIVTRVPTARGARQVFTFDPSIPGDFVRASKLARECGGSVQRFR